MLDENIPLKERNVQGRNVSGANKLYIILYYNKYKHIVFYRLAITISASAGNLTDLYNIEVGA